MSVCGGGAGTVQQVFFFFFISLQPVAVVSIIHKSGESSVQCGGGLEPAVFSSHSAENEKSFSLRGDE